jgi:chitinase
MTRAAGARGSARRLFWGIVVATGALSSSSLLSCAFGTEDFTAPGAPGGEPTPTDVDAMAEIPGTDAGGPVLTKVDASTGKDAGVAPDAGAAGEDAGKEPDATAVPDTGVTSNDAGADAGGATDAGGVACDGLKEWFAGTTDQKVKHFGEEYTCLVAGWCSESSSTGVSAYEPGKGWAWTDAWQDSGPCPTSAP